LQEAADFNTAFLKDVAANVLAAGQLLDAKAASISAYMAFGPPGSEEFFKRICPAGIGYFEAWLPDFGACLLKAMQTLFSMGHDSAVVLNADSPTLPTALLAETADVLARPGDRAVLGPSTDGGYYLLGLKQVHRRLFEDIEWSTERVCSQTLQRAGQLGLDLHQLPVWYDVDDAAAVQLIRCELYEGGSFDKEQTPNTPIHTLELLKSLMASSDFGERIGVKCGN
jgi:hypothetical protein